MKAIKARKEILFVIAYFALMTAVALLSSSCATATHTASFRVDDCPTWAKR